MGCVLGGYGKRVDVRTGMLHTLLHTLIQDCSCLQVVEGTSSIPVITKPTTASNDLLIVPVAICATCLTNVSLQVKPAAAVVHMPAASFVATTPSSPAILQCIQA